MNSIKIRKARGLYNGTISSLCLLALLHTEAKGAAEKMSAQQANQTPAAARRRLPESNSLDRDMRAGESHTYLVEVLAGECVEVAVEQAAIDIVITLAGEDGREILQVNNSHWNREPERIEIVSEQGGDYTLTLKMAASTVNEGRYRIYMADRRRATDLDKAIMEANRVGHAGMMARNAGRIASAVELLEQCLLLRERALGPYHPSNAAALTSLGTMYTETGAYQRAEQSLEHALDIYEKVLIEDHYLPALVSTGLGVLYTRTGDYSKAIQAYQRALEIWERTLGPGYAPAAAVIGDLGSLYFETGAYDKAEPLLARALGMRLKTPAAASAGAATLLNNLGNLYRVKGEHAKAEQMLQQALDVSEKASGSYSAGLALALNNLALLYSDKGERDKAEPLLKRALEMEAQAYGDDNSRTAREWQALSSIYLSEGKTSEALESRARSNSAREQELRLNLSTGSEEQKLIYLSRHSSDVDETIGLHLMAAPDDPKAARLATEIILRRKGRALDVMVDREALPRHLASPEDQPLFDRLAEARARYAAALRGGPEGEGLERFKAQVKELRDGVEDLEAKLNARSVELRSQSLPVTLDAVQRALPDGAALVEYALYRSVKSQGGSNSPGTSPRYAAYVIRARGEPKGVDLGDAQEINRLIARWRERLQNPYSDDVNVVARSLDEKIMLPARRLAGGATRYLVSPVGALTLAPFAALVDERGRYLIESYHIFYLASGRDLLRLGTEVEGSKPPLVIAAPDFDKPVAAKKELAQANGAMRDRGGLAGVRFIALPGADEEVEPLKRLLVGATILTKGLATETALKQAARPRLLHIATRAVFLDYAQGPPSRISKSESPLLRSGLALASANAGDRDGDGILTALEVAKLDLWGTKLVTVSACDTRIGDQDGEGVYALRRALVLAGSESQLINLWKLDCDVAREHAVAYYKGVLAGQARSEAVRKAQRQMAKKKQTAHPYYWAAFALSGEWRAVASRNK